MNRTNPGACWLVPYASRAKAVEVEAELYAMQAARYPTAGRPCQATRCTRCGQWHLTPTRPKETHRA